MRARYGIVDASTAVIEMAEAAGISMTAGAKVALRASTFGVGQLVLDAARREVGARYRATSPYLPCTMESEIFLRSRSTFSTQTRTVSPTRTTSLGCLTKRLAIFEMCTRPSW